MERSFLSERALNCLDYLRDLASASELKSDDGEVLLQRQYDKLTLKGTDTVIANYLDPQKYKVQAYRNTNIIFPFGGNTSQFKAVKDALSNQISIVQGPPGTGKTQTILNIIANLLIMGQSVQIVSNNNSAIFNVMEKLENPSYGLGFLVASLGRKENKEKFIDNQTGSYPVITEWELDYSLQMNLYGVIEKLSHELSVAFSLQERLAKARAELDSLNVEIEYFRKYCYDINFTPVELKLRYNISVDMIMQLWQECCDNSEKERSLSLWFKIRGRLIYGIKNWQVYENDLSTFITQLQNMFYGTKKAELSNEIKWLEKQLHVSNVSKKMADLTSLSLKYLKANLFERYGNKQKRRIFTEDDLWKNASEVIEEYPIILSTTFSSNSSLKRVTYDYLIMDEASQVDIATGALALSCAKNAVIVGDLKQLPNIVTEEMKQKCDLIFDSYDLPHGYSFTKNSFLGSVCEIISDAPQTMLKEHYRCHPKIIGFCNQKFYNNELIIMTEDKNECDTLLLFKTVIGNHKREHYNQRQIDVMCKEALPLLNIKNINEVGIIAPYRDQVNAINRQLGTNLLEVDTVHKFQGREKDTIILTTVDDVVTDFSDDPYLLNVAVSRAKNRLCLIASGNEQPLDSNIKDLISYIEYNNFRIIQSDVRSVFDLMYTQYTDARIKFLEKKPNDLVCISERLMFYELTIILKQYSELMLEIICHQSLKEIISNTDILNEVEYRYVMNPVSHVDFMLFNKINKKPVLAIEVDGFSYHKPGTNQYERDKLKNHIFEKSGIPLIRFPTNGSEEYIKIEQFLAGYKNRR